MKPQRGDAGQASTSYLGGLFPADIVFVLDGSTSKRDRTSRFTNTWGQRAVSAWRKRRHIPGRGTIPIYSHVMLGLEGGLVIHADGRSVSVDVFAEAVRYGRQDQSSFSVYRMEAISTALREEIARVALSYYEQRYRFWRTFLGWGSGASGARFCSQLAAHSYRAAGFPLSELPDHRVLPIDLYAACRSNGWSDLSERFKSEPVTSDAVAAMGTIKLPGRGEVVFSKFMQEIDDILLHTARLSKQMKKVQHESVRETIVTSALISQRAVAMFDLAKLTRIRPGEIDEFSVFPIERVLQQVPSLLPLSLLRNVDDISAHDSIIFTLPGLPAYVGMPSVDQVEKMTRTTEIIRIYTALMFAETGLLCILAACEPDEKFEAFRSVKPEFVNRFWNALEQPLDLTLYEKPKELFRWVENAEDRATSCTRLSNIVAALRVIEIFARPSVGPVRADPERI